MANTAGGAYNRRRRKRRLGIMLRLFLWGVIIGIVVAVGMLFFKAEEVHIRGAERYDAALLYDTAAVPQGRQLFLLPRSRIKQSLLDAHPYLHEVNVKIKLPDTVIITVTECQPVAYIDSHGRHWIVDMNGKILESVPLESHSVGIEVRGVTLDEPAVNTYFHSPESGELQKQTYDSLIAALQTYGYFKDIDYIDMTSIADIMFSLKGRYVVRLGVVSDLNAKLGYLTEVLRELEAQKPHLSGTIILSEYTETRMARFIEDID